MGKLMRVGSGVPVFRKRLNRKGGDALLKEPMDYVCCVTVHINNIQN